MVSFSVDLEGFSLRFRVEAVPRVPRARRLRMVEGSGTVGTVVVCIFHVKIPSINAFLVKLPPKKILA